MRTDINRLNGSCLEECEVGLCWVNYKKGICSTSKFFSSFYDMSYEPAYFVLKVAPLVIPKRKRAKWLAPYFETTTSKR